MNLTSRLGIEDRPLFEKVLLRIVGIGALASIISVPFSRAMLVTAWPIVFSGVTGAVLLAASTLRGRDDTAPFNLRVLAAAGAGAVGLYLGSFPAAAVAAGAFAGAAMAGAPGTAGSRRILGAIGGGAGVTWALWLIPELLRTFRDLPVPALAVGASVISAGLFGLGLLALHLRVHADALSARLQLLGSESGQRLHRTWDRCQQALRRAPAAARAEVSALLDTLVREAARMLASAENLESRLRAANPADAQTQLAQLKLELTTARDPLTRERLQSAALSLSDSLEHLESLERKRERFAAELRLKLATLERAALALETAQGEPDELRTLALRLSAP